MISLDLLKNKSEWTSLFWLKIYQYEFREFDDWRHGHFWVSVVFVSEIKKMRFAHVSLTIHGGGTCLLPTRSYNISSCSNFCGRGVVPELFSREYAVFTFKYSFIRCIKFFISSTATASQPAKEGEIYCFHYHKTAQENIMQYYGVGYLVACITTPQRTNFSTGTPEIVTFISFAE